MKSLAALMTALTLGGSLLAAPTLAETKVEDGAKGLFFEQLDHPADNLNTGIQYWIELKHGSETVHATNKTAFHTGDRIRFHVRPNIDGFAYIMLKSGSRGEQAVLFPSKDRDEDNKISRGKEIVLPKDGTIRFDENPGIEKLTLLVSRKPIDADSYMSKIPTTPPADNNTVAVEPAPRLVAMASSGSKDIIPNQVLVSYLPSDGGVPESVKAAAARAKDNQTTSAVSTKAQTTTKITKTIKSASSGAGKTSNTGSSGSNSSSGSTGSSGSSSSSSSNSNSTSNRAPKYPHKVADKATHRQIASETIQTTASAADAKIDKGSAKAGLVTVVFKDPNSVLAADISLEHL